MQSTETSFENLRKDFPILKRTVRDNKRLVYLDNASTTQKPNQVIDAITNYYLTSKKVTLLLPLNMNTTAT